MPNGRELSFAPASDVSAAFDSYNLGKQQISSQCWFMCSFYVKFWKTVCTILAQNHQQYLLQLQADGESIEHIKPFKVPRLYVGMLGCGILGRRVLKKLLDSECIQGDRVLVSTRHPLDSVYSPFKKRGVRFFHDNAQLFEKAGLVFVCCLPHQLNLAASGLANSDRRDGGIDKMNSLLRYYHNPTSRFARNNQPQQRRPTEKKGDLEKSENEMDTTELETARTNNSFFEESKTSRVHKNKSGSASSLIFSLCSSVSEARLQTLFQVDHVTRTCHHPNCTAKCFATSFANEMTKTITQTISQHPLFCNVQNLPAIANDLKGQFERRLLEICTDEAVQAPVGRKIECYVPALEATISSTPQKTKPKLLPPVKNHYI